MELNKIKDKMKTLLIYVLLFLFSFYAITFQNSGYAQVNQTYKIKIKVKYALAQPGDTLILKFGPQAIDSRIKSTYHNIVDAQGVCTFNAETEFEYGYISINKIKNHPKWRSDSKGLANNLFWEKEDNILITIPDNPNINDYTKNTTFTGIGSEKYKTLYAIREELHNYYDDAQELPKLETGYFLNPFTDNIAISTEKVSRLLTILDRNKNELSPLAYDVFKSDILLAEYAQASEMIVSYYYSNIADVEDSLKNAYVQRIKSLFLPYMNINVSDEGMAASYEFQKCYSNVFFTLSIINDKSSNLSNMIKNIKSIGSGIKEESIILSTVNKMGIKENQEGINEIKKILKTSRYQIMLNKQLKFVGKNILNYYFIDTLGNTVQLSKFKGKLLLIDFWYSGCSGCAKLYQNIISKIEEEFKDEHKFAVVSISCDTKLEKWLNSIKKNQYTNEECINLSTGPEGMTHPFVSDLGIFKYPYLILVDESGNIVMADTVELRDNIDSLRNVIVRYL